MTAGPTRSPGGHTAPPTAWSAPWWCWCCSWAGSWRSGGLGRDPDVDPVKTVDYQPHGGAAGAGGREAVALAPDPGAGRLAGEQRGLRARPGADLAPRDAHRPREVRRRRGVAVGGEGRGRGVSFDPDAQRGEDVRGGRADLGCWTDSGGDYALVLATPKETALVGGSAGEKAVRGLVEGLGSGRPVSRRPGRRRSPRRASCGRRRARSGRPGPASPPRSHSAIDSARLSPPCSRRRTAWTS